MKILITGYVYLHYSKRLCTWRCSRAVETSGSRSLAQSPLCALRCCAGVSSQPQPHQCCPGVDHIGTSPHCQSFPVRKGKLNEHRSPFFPLLLWYFTWLQTAHIAVQNLGASPLKLKCFARVRCVVLKAVFTLFCTLPSCCRNMRCLSSNWAGSWLSKPPVDQPEPTALFGRMSLSTINS